jgi:hypothetical protein
MIWEMIGKAGWVSALQAEITLTKAPWSQGGQSANMGLRALSLVQTGKLENRLAGGGIFVSQFVKLGGTHRHED